MQLPKPPNTNPKNLLEHCVGQSQKATYTIQLAQEFSETYACGDDNNDDDGNNDDNLTTRRIVSSVYTRNDKIISGQIKTTYIAAATRTWMHG